MDHLHNFGEFEQIFYAMVKGAFDITDIHDYYIHYKQNKIFEDCEEFLRDFLQDNTREAHCLYLKDN